MLRQQINTPTLKGYEHINRYWDPRLRQPAAKILPGEAYVSKTGEVIVTVLSSCVAVCIRDTRIGVGGMSHFTVPMLSQKSSEEHARLAAEAYACWAIEQVANEIYKQGGQRAALEVKIYGGGPQLVAEAPDDMGARNAQFLRDYFAREGIRPLEEGLEGDFPRKISYFPDTGATRVNDIRTRANDTIEQREQDYNRALLRRPDLGDLELFV